jgi:hypothetical protein
MKLVGKAGESVDVPIGQLEVPCHYTTDVFLPTALFSNLGTTLRDHFESAITVTDIKDFITKQHMKLVELHKFQGWPDEEISFSLMIKALEGTRADGIVQINVNDDASIDWGIKRLLFMSQCNTEQFEKLELGHVMVYDDILNLVFRN